MHIKAPLPLTHLQGKPTLPLIEAYFEFNHLKQLYRQGWLRRGIPPEQCESVAEHTFGVAMLAMFLADAHFPDLDLIKVLRLALLHDLGEIYSGDLTPADGVSPAEKKRREAEAVVEVLAKLPDGESYLELWREYEQQQSAEARLVKQIDRLEMILQASVYEHQEWADLGEFFVSVEPVLSEPPFRTLWEALMTLRQDNQREAQA
ncbi:MAG: HD domain-containing protein [Anaerolineales bacterium]|nr:HD domain-containing protein [Anaerolineales bacterium]